MASDPQTPTGIIIAAAIQTGTLAGRVASTAGATPMDVSPPMIGTRGPKRSASRAPSTPTHPDRIVIGRNVSPVAKDDSPRWSCR